MTAASPARYSAVAMIFHWLIAIAVIANWRIAEAAEHAEMPEKISLFGTHKALGMAILALTLGRLVWRFAKPTPALSAGLAAWERALAKITHLLFYILLIGLPLGGWLASSYGGRPIDFFGLFTIPVLPVGANDDAAGQIFDLHATGGTILIALVGLHILGALKHTFVDKDGNLWRMLPFGTPKA